MRQFSYSPKGVCSMQIRFELDEQDVVHNVQFLGGCPGNTLGIATLAEGKRAQDLIAQLKGISKEEVEAITWDNGVKMYRMDK